jgi:hypothetical protein
MGPNATDRLPPNVIDAADMNERTADLESMRASRFRELATTKGGRTKDEQKVSNLSTELGSKSQSSGCNT